MKKILEEIEIVECTPPFGEKTYFECNFHFKYTSIFGKTYYKNVIDHTHFKTKKAAQDYASYVLKPWKGKYNCDKNIIRKTSIDKKISKLISFLGEHNKHWFLILDRLGNNDEYVIVAFSYWPHNWIMTDSEIEHRTYWDCRFVMSACSLKELETKIDNTINHDSLITKKSIDKVYHLDDKAALILPKAKKQRNAIITTEIKRTENYLNFLKGIS